MLFLLGDKDVYTSCLFMIECFAETSSSLSCSLDGLGCIHSRFLV